jgi:hypothetical protein
MTCPVRVTDRPEKTTTYDGKLRRDTTALEEAKRQHQMEIQSRGRLNTIDTIIPLKKSKRTSRRGIDRWQHRVTQWKQRIRRVQAAQNVGVIATIHGSHTRGESERVRDE